MWILGRERFVSRWRERHTEPPKDSDKYELFHLFQRERPKLNAIAEKYRRYAFSHGPTDREKIERLVNDCYAVVGLQKPKTFLWFDSPPKAVLTTALVVWREAVRYWEVDLLPSTRHFASGISALGPGEMLTHFQAMMEVQSRGPDIQMLSTLIEDEILDDWSEAAFSFSNVLQNGVRTTFRELDERDYQFAIDAWLNHYLEIEQRVANTELAEYWRLVGRDLWSIDNSSARNDVAQLPDTMNSLIAIGARGQQDAIVCALYDCLLHLGMPISRTFENLVACIIEGAWFWPYLEFCIACDRPTELSLNPIWRLHKHDDLAIRFPDGWGVYAISGVPVSEDIANGRFTVGEIDAEDNIEVRRAMIDRYGLSQYLFDSGCEVVHRDKFGTLYRKASDHHDPWDQDEPIMMVEVINKTAEPDGSFKRYFLRVPPSMRTARQAVAWTFGLSESEYKPRKET